MSRLLSFLLLICLAPAMGCRPLSTSGDPIGAGGGEATATPVEAEQLRRRIDDALTYTYEHRTLNLKDHAAWQILHGVLTYGKRYNVLNDGQPVGAVQWVLDGNPMKGFIPRPGTEDVETLITGQASTGDSEKSRQGLIMVMEPGSKTGQGHPDQWLAILSQCNLPSDTPIVAGGQPFEIGDIVRQTMWEIHEGKEASWTLAALAHYLPIEAEWYAADGQIWSLERIIAMEAAQDINASACGGSHRLAFMAMALARYRESLDDPGAELTGGWLAADEKIQQAIRTAREQQNPNGSFSAAYFARPSQAHDFSLEIGTTGHVLEFLALAMTDEQLKEPWVERAALRLCDVFDSTQKLSLECGGLYHAAHGLLTYHERRWGEWEYPGSQK